MSIFDKKEEVFDIQLTQYGRQLLSDGKFSPKYYKFFDDDVIYKPNFEELNSYAGDRIKNKTIKLKTQGAIAVNSYSRSNTKTQNEREKYRLQQCYLGNSSNSSKYAPATEIFFGKGEINRIESELTSSSGSYSQKIPQIFCKDSEFLIETIEDVTEYSDEPEWQFNEGEFTDEGSYFQFTTEKWGNNKRFKITGDHLTLEILEHNTEFLKDNFELEIFEIAENSEGEDELVSIPFAKKFEKICEDERPKYIQHYLNIQTDYNIDERVLCNDIFTKRKKNKFTDMVQSCENVYEIVIDELNVYKQQEAGNDYEDIC